MITRIRYPKGFQFFDGNGKTLALAELFYYSAGTTTPQDTYSDSEATTANTNPVLLDGSGRLPVNIYLGSRAGYKEVLAVSGVVVAPWPDDNIPAATATGGGLTGVDLGVTESATSITITNTAGLNATVPPATATAAGVMIAADKAKLDGLSSGGSAAAMTGATASAAGAGGTVPAPLAGQQSYVLLGNSVWTSVPSALATQNLDNVARLGIGTADTGNALSVKGATSLFSNSGDCRVTMSKGAAANTAAFNFQDNYSTRVQFGLLGNDSFTLATSADGSVFNNALVATSAGVLSFPATPVLLGNASANLTAGYTATSYNLGTPAAGSTVTLNAVNGNVQHLTNGGAFTLAPFTGGGTIQLDITNSASAGAITLSGFAITSGSMAATSGNKYRIVISNGQGGARADIVGLQS